MGRRQYWGSTGHGDYLFFWGGGVLRYWWVGSENSWRWGPCLVAVLFVAPCPIGDANKGDLVSRVRFIVALFHQLIKWLQGFASESLARLFRPKSCIAFLIMVLGQMFFCCRVSRQEKRDFEFNSKLPLCKSSSRLGSCSTHLLCGPLTSLGTVDYFPFYLPLPIFNLSYVNHDFISYSYFEIFIFVFCTVWDIWKTEQMKTLMVLVIIRNITASCA